MSLANASFPFASAFLASRMIYNAYKYVPSLFNAFCSIARNSVYMGYGTSRCVARIINYATLRDVGERRPDFVILIGTIFLVSNEQLVIVIRTSIEYPVTISAPRPANGVVKYWFPPNICGPKCLASYFRVLHDRYRARSKLRRVYRFPHTHTHTRDTRLSHSGNYIHVADKLRRRG